MNCEQTELQMAELLAGEIGPDERRAVERHLLECAACRADFDRARAGMRADWPDAPVPPALVASTRALVLRPPALVRLLRGATAAAAALLLALSLVPAGPPGRVAARTRPAAPLLATMQEGAVGALFAKDEDGRPVGELGLRSHVVSVEILDGIARTTVEENFENHTDRRLEGTFHFPLPPDASISRLALEVNGKMEEGTCLERERAREVFESIVRRMQDPALLEWMPGGIFKCRVFPIEPRATKRVLVAYTQALPFFRGRATYVYPLASEKTRTHPPGEVRIDVLARFSGRLEKIESPSHRIDVQRRNAHEARMSFRAEAYRPENDFVVSMETDDEELRVVAHREDGDDGYFALFLSPRGAAARTPRRYALVLDVSASVSAPELEVARRLVRAMIERRIPGDRFEILAHHIDVASSGEVDLRAANDFMDGLRPLGGSDVLRALLAAEADEIVYIGEGTPTLGETETPKILEALKGRRIRTVAVGSDANAALLERLGGHHRISPNDDVDRRVAEIAKTLGSPVLSDLRIEGGEAVSDVVGVRDVFFGERLVAAGRFRGPARLVVTAGGYRRETELALPPEGEGASYVKRLWAQRKVADLLARGGAKEEVVALGVKHQIMTPYTSFLVLESEQMWKDHNLKREVPKPDEVLGDGKARSAFDEATRLYKEGKLDEATARFDEAFRLQPSSDEVYRYMKRAGDDFVAQMMNHPERRFQDVGRRVYERAKPGLPLRTGEETRAKFLQDLGSDDAAVRRNAFWHLGRLGDMSSAGFTTNESARLESFDLRGQTFHSILKMDPLWSGYLSLDGREDLHAGIDPAVFNLDEREVLELHDARDILLKLEDFAGPKVELVSASAGGWAPLTGATFAVENDLSLEVRELEAAYARVEELRSMQGRTPAQRELLAAEVEYSRQYAERLSRDQAELEKKHFERARDGKILEEKINHLNMTGTRPGLAPRRTLEGKATAVATEIGLVVISIGKDDGVREGDEFTVFRGGDFVAKVAIDRTDLKWSGGKVVLKKTDPRPGDDVSNHVFVAGPRSTPGRVEQAEGEEVLLRGGPFVRGQLVAIWRDSKFVALVQMLDGTVGRVWRGMAAGRMLPGDRAEPAGDVRATLAALPEDVRVELGSRAGLESMRAKMRIGR